MSSSERWDGPRPALSPRPFRGLLPDQAELLSTCSLGPWKTHASLQCQDSASGYAKSLPAADFLQFSFGLVREVKGTAVNQRLKHCLLLAKT